MVPERFGCCRGSDQARGVIASFVRRAFGRTFLRGVAMIRQAALAAIPGGATRADSFADGDMAGAENAWGALAGTSTAVPRPSCKLEAEHHRGSWR